MKRRDFLEKAPIAAAALTGSTVAGVATDARARSTGRQGPEGFRLVMWTRRRPEAPVMGVLREFTVHEYVVECPYPVGSRAWLSIADRDEEGNVVACDETGPVPLVKKHRRVIFPRFRAEDIPEDIESRVRGVFAAACVHGFDEVDGPEHEWKVVHVEVRCPDGVEHIVCGLPEEWDSRLCLGVMVKGQIVA